ncbi:hypothetical protein JYP46_07725 [Nitratireductor aquimarinus]|uniref:hypothetical protein n=1 Tax=Alphaproteobacteria TaxID=28211 RepID=UPI0019D3A639|nr:MULTISPECIES: hypothetical protein [Alphaproteobacteria]MBN7756698.1 hypothetical protein [Nitratireductor aquimarinus]MBY5999685.1 hypothetical protein [Tritonibacter mobilis]MBY6021711.1 hypothetical protein [Nitratireductor sp. DP7N14-4]
MMKRLFACLFVVGLAGCQSDTQTSQPMTTMPPAGGGAGVTDLVGARGAGGEMQLMARGYTLSRTQGLTAYWWNAASGNCVRVVTSDGRYQSVDPVGPAECGQASMAASAPAGGPPADIADLVGARGAGGETQLMARGYTLARTQGLTAYWWKASTGTCARVVTADGRYQTVAAASAADCRA